ncbi:hypothetical protein PTKIN_Ptkin09bG0137200 [Pterospermum kingtungense]
MSCMGSVLGSSEIRKSPAHIAIHEESLGKLMITHSSSFLRLGHFSDLWPASSYGEGVIIGIIDLGVWPESESFNDRGMPSIAQRWKGKCENSTTSPFPCKKKLIGARASQFGYAKGTTRGIAPCAHVAMYKVSNTEDIAESDVLTAMDQEIADGVDIMSLSLGLDQKPYFKDVIAIASLSACEKDIVVCAAESLNKNETTGKIVFCDYVGITKILQQILELYRIGAYAEYAIGESNVEVKAMRFVLTSLGTKPLDYDAGHINPNKAMDLELIYDIDTQDYIDFLCG